MKIGDIPIKIERKKVKYIRIRVLPPDGEVRVSAPWRCSNAAISEFLTQKAEWIITTRQKILNSQKLPDLFGKRDALVWIWGKVYLFTPSYPAGAKPLELRYEKLQREILGRELERLVPLWESRLGVRAENVRIRKMKTRWGSCNHRAGRIWFNLELVRYPLQALEMVVVHELIHLLEPNHGREFYLLMNQYLPDWENRQHLLNQYFNQCP